VSRPWCPLSRPDQRHWKKDRASEDFRSTVPRFRENLGRNLQLVEKLRAVADARGVTVAQLAIAWVLAQGPDIVPLIGARTRDRLAESLKALEVRLGDADLAQIERAIPPGAAAGDRYDAHQMRILDSET
jgi:aryl-alcohol dehydrogenase-like predicted oxidoreductase